MTNTGLRLTSKVDIKQGYGPWTADWIQGCLESLHTWLANAVAAPVLLLLPPLLLLLLLLFSVCNEASRGAL